MTHKEKAFEMDVQLEHLADEIAPVVSEYIQETIAWQTDGNKYTEHLSGNKYIEFVKQLKIKIINKLV